MTKTQLNRRQRGVSGLTSFQVLVLMMLAAIILGIGYIAFRETPGSKLLRAVDKVVEDSELVTPERAREAAAKLDITLLLSSLALYKLDTGNYPTEAEGLKILKTAKTPVRSGTLYDPWGHVYLYANPGKHGGVDVYSGGPDGLPDTADDIRDSR